MQVAPVVLEGRHVRLEPLAAEHFAALHRHADKSVFTHLLDWPEGETLEDFVAWMRSYTSRTNNQIAFAIILKESGEPIGSTSFLDIRPAHRALEIGSTWISPRHQGSDVNPESKLLLLRHAFESLGAVRVQLKTSSENLRSQRAIEKLGAKREGVLRNYQMRQNGRPRDTVMFSLVDTEWPRVKVRLLRRLGVSARDALIDLLKTHKPADDKERADLEVMLGYARFLEDPFSRAQETAHFTASAVVVSPDGERVCLVHHAKLERWLQPGGHSDPSDEGSMEIGAIREVIEETGLDATLEARAPRPLDVDVHVIPERKGESEHRHLDVRYLVRATNMEMPRPDSTESLGARWLTWDDALAVASDAGLKRLLNKARTIAANS
jgi:RimJ/RimL family protein N-acetyltransferase/8-oxo-dGTP pyrophosphatase MutT (NUDIX family)